MVIGFGFTFGFAGMTAVFFVTAFAITFFAGFFATTFFVALEIGFFETFLVDGVALVATFLTDFLVVGVFFLIGITYVSIITKKMCFVNQYLIDPGGEFG
jgi:hypothetical protein